MAEEIARLQTEVAVLTAKLEAAEKRAQGIEAHATERLADRDDQIEQLRTDAERERADHRDELDRLVAAHAAALGRLQELLNRLTAPWWRRWLQR